MYLGFRLSNVLRYEIFVLQKWNQLCMYVHTLLSCLKMAAIDGDSIWAKLNYLRISRKNENNWSPVLLLFVEQQLPFDIVQKSASVKSKSAGGL